MNRDAFVHPLRHLARSAQVVQERLSRRLRLPDRDPRFELGDDGKELDAHLPRRCRLDRRHGHRHPELCIRIRELKLGRHDADDRIVRAVELDVSADERRLGAKNALPQVVAQQDDAIPAGYLLVLGEIAAVKRFDAEHRKKGRGDVLTFDAPRLGAPGQVEADIAKGSHPFKNVVFVTPRAIVIQRERRHLLGIRAHARPGLPNPHEGLRVFIR